MFLSQIELSALNLSLFPGTASYKLSATCRGIYSGRAEAGGGEGGRGCGLWGILELNDAVSDRISKKCPFNQSKDSLGILFILLYFPSEYFYLPVNTGKFYCFQKPALIISA